MRNTRRNNRIKVHIVADTISLVIASIPTVILIALNAPTWAWVTIGFAIWTYASNMIMKELQNDRDIRRLL